MKPNHRARTAAAVTLSKGKMYEYGIDVADHLPLPQDIDLTEQFPFAIGTLGDAAAEISSKHLGHARQEETPVEDLLFSARVLQAFDEALLNDNFSFDIALLAAASFYLSDIPGNATVLVKKISAIENSKIDPLAQALLQVLDKPWADISKNTEYRVENLLSALTLHFQTGDTDALTHAQKILKDWAYEVGSPHELLLSDLLVAISATKVNKSAWSLLPTYSDLPREQWASYLTRVRAIKEMWPSQRLLGDAGLYKGSSAVVQMPTSAGKTRATEIVLRAAFLSGRTTLALIVAPFRALCQEIATDLGNAFIADGYKVNQLSDAIQPDFTLELLELFDIQIEKTPHVVVLTPEKLLYVLRQRPDLAEEIGLIIYDEGHQFDTGRRGVTYELLLTSIKGRLKADAQSILISAVIQNPAALASWLLGSEEKIVSNKNLQARRVIAFASMQKEEEGELHFNVASDGEQIFYVPRAILRELLSAKKGEKSPRFFPVNKPGPIALYLGLRVVGNGGVAIYVGVKASAIKIIRDFVEDTYPRGISMDVPEVFSDRKEIRRFINLFTENFGSESYLTKAAGLGIFAHHGNTPNGLRLAIEHAMREGHIRFIVCTSTLAQGVNLPIRYLFVTSSVQGSEKIKTRDFHNLMGRAGRAGMYGEGTIIFTDPKLYDDRLKKPAQWSSVKDLIHPDSAGPTGSTLLSLLKPMTNTWRDKELDNPTPFEIVLALIDDPNSLYEEIQKLSPDLIEADFTVKDLEKQLNEKKDTLEAIESYLMTYRGDIDFQDFLDTARNLAQETFAHSLASEEQKLTLEEVFSKVAERIQRHAPDVTQQIRYGRTLLGLDSALQIDKWVSENIFTLSFLSTEDQLFEALWPLFVNLSSEKILVDTIPLETVIALAKNWISGMSYEKMLDILTKKNAKYPYGAQMRVFKIDDVVEICEHTFGFEFSLYLAAINEAFLANDVTEDERLEFSGMTELLQKRLKYGLSSKTAVSIFEIGFSERVVAQKISEAIPWGVVNSSAEARELIRENKDEVRTVLEIFPSYFSMILERTAP